jgi:hypothetical protein
MGIELTKIAGVNGLTCLFMGQPTNWLAKGAEFELEGGSLR